MQVNHLDQAIYRGTRQQHAGLPPHFQGATSMLPAIIRGSVRPAPVTRRLVEQLVVDDVARKEIIVLVRLALKSEIFDPQGAREALRLDAGTADNLNDQPRHRPGRSPGTVLREDL